MGDGFEGLRQGHTTHGCAIIEQRGEVEPNPLWHRVLSFVMVGREFYSISPLLRNACASANRCKLPKKLAAIASPVRRAWRWRFHTLLYRARQRKGLRGFALGQCLRHVADHVAQTAGLANGERVRRWFQDNKAGW